MIDAQNLLTKLKNQEREECDEVLCHQLDDWISQIEVLEALRALSDHFVIKDMIAGYVERLRGLDKILLEKRKMTEVERENLLDRKDLYKEFIHSFNAEDRLSEIAKDIENL